ncbi:MAG: helix-hairpin-helix domain-containing protein [Gemmatimonadota bacterium]|nr:helix-hairpin-helix domain-containing protein [Gemmatimonadota bacterium]
MTPDLNLEAKLAILMSLAAADREGSPGRDPSMPLPPRLRHANDVGALRPLNIRSVRAGGGGGQKTLLRILMTNACSFNCHYCPMRRDREMPRTLLKPEELVRIFLAARQRGWCEGLFITTGIPGRPVKVMDDLIRVLELLRDRHHFRGYIHVKILAGAEQAQVERITALASRVSLNLEAPCGESLSRIAPDKSFASTIVTLERARTLVNRARGEERDGRPRDELRPGGTAGMTMQLVVGATPDSDRAIIGKVSELYAGGGIHHAQFSAFRPIRDTPMEDVRATPALRELRLYQADHLMRGYGFAPQELTYDDDGNLPLSRDPKVAWALAHPERFPVEIRTASPLELLRVPGVGPATARRIVAERGAMRLRDLADVRRLGVITGRAAGFLTLGGRRLQTTRWTEQLGFWAAGDDAGVPHIVYDVSPGTFR